MREQKEVYSDEKKAYENRTPEEIEAANAAAAAAALVRTLMCGVRVWSLNFSRYGVYS